MAAVKKASRFVGTKLLRQLQQQLNHCSYYSYCGILLNRRTVRITQGLPWCEQQLAV
jgi:hypothetical protein